MFSKILLWFPLALLALPGCDLFAEKLPGDDTDAHEDSEHGEDSESGEEEEDFHWPSTEGWDDPGILGWMGRTKISTTEGCWVDTDGVAPELAGCHTLNSGDSECGTCEPDFTETIGELCYTFSHTGESGELEEFNWLVETNPGQDVCHLHAGGEGHPDVFDCDAFCKGTVNEKTGEPYSGGSCAEMPDIDCSGVSEDAAYCLCAE